MEFPASLLEKYRVDEKIGEGGMGTIYRATQTALDRPAAVKFLGAPVFGARDALARFRDEARVCARMHHRNVVEVFDFDVDCAKPYIVFELVEGTNLKKLIDGHAAVPVAQVLDWMAQVCDGLQHAHAAGIVHRDLKPENILFSADGTPKVADFGLAKLGGVTTSQTKTGIVLGTPAYMSPEQASERELTAASDLYSVGILLFELLAGTPPFDGATDMDVLLKHVKAPPPRLRDLEPKLPERLERLVLQCLEKAPAARPGDASGLAAKLRALATPAEGFDPTKVTVTLGCREGAMRSVRLDLGPPAPGARRGGARRPTAPAASLLSQGGATKVSAVGVPLAPGAPAPRRWPLVFSAVALALGLAALGPRLVRWGSGSAAAGGEVQRLTVEGRGARSVLLSWDSPWRWEHPVVRVRRTRDGYDAPCQVELLEASAAPSKEGTFRHLVVARGLPASSSSGQATTYEAWLEPPGGPRTLGRAFAAAPFAPFKPPPELALGADGSVVVTLRGKVPFEVLRRSGPEPLAEPAPTVGGRYHNALALAWPLERLVGGGPLELDLKSIDGEEHQVRLADVREALVAALGDVWEAFRASRDSGEFHRDGTALYEILNRAGGSLARADKASEAVRRGMVRDAWTALEKRVRAWSWFRRLEPLAPGLPRLLASPSATEPVKAAAALALAPLDLVEGMAAWCKVAPNTEWDALRAARPYPLTYDGSGLAPGAAATELRYASQLGAMLDLFVDAKFHILYDSRHPKFQGPASSKLSPELRRSLTSATYEVPLEADRLAGASGAELELTFRGAYVSLSLLAEVNGKFTAVFRDRTSDWLAMLEEVLYGGSRVYSRLGSLLLFEKVTDPSRLPQVLEELDKILPAKLRTVAHPIPLAALRPGANRFLLSVLSSPISDLEGPVLVSCRLRTAAH